MLVLLQVWSESLGQPLAHLGDESHGSAVCVAFHRDGQQVLAGYHSGHLRLYDINTGTAVSCMDARQHQSWRCSVVVSGVRRMNEVNARQARLVRGWVTMLRRVYHLGM